MGSAADGSWSVVPSRALVPVAREERARGRGEQVQAAHVEASSFGLGEGHQGCTDAAAAAAPRDGEGSQEADAAVALDADHPCEPTLLPTAEEAAVARDSQVGEEQIAFGQELP